MRQKTYGCNLCWDAGLLCVIHPEIAREIREAVQAGIADQFDLKGRNPSAAARCTCSKGNAMGKAIPMYHSGMIPLPSLFGSIEEKQQQLIQAYLEYTAPQDFNSQFS